MKWLIKIWHALMPYLMIHLFTIPFLKLAYTIMPKHCFKCALEVLQLVKAHKCSSRNVIKLGHSIHPNLIGDAEYNICYNLSSIIRQCEVKAETHDSNNEIDVISEPSYKKARRSSYDVLEEEIRQFSYRQPIRKLHHRKRFCRIKSLAM